MNLAELINEIKQKKTYLCVGLDTEIDKIPNHLRNSENPVLEFNKAIIEATKKYCVAYKINIAFYEQYGSTGWDTIKKTLEHIPDNFLKIADAKRGDIGNTARMYARTFFETYKFDAVTLSPYMGADTIMPFLEYKNKFSIVLALTSNNGSRDFQMLKIGNEFLYQNVLRKISILANPENLMFVAGATNASELIEIRKIVPQHFLLVPGIGAQGGDLEAVSDFGLNETCGILINSSRSIIYASNNENFADAAQAEALKLKTQMQNYLAKKYIVND
ncbi:MAG: orotidine-5'-phosphate decarboxylase [Bacteroidetes bacterium]|nr:orotidine-5'-phosphate decarboxylase [Bacteroidota bacterium]